MKTLKLLRCSLSLLPLTMLLGVGPLRTPQPQATPRPTTLLAATGVPRQFMLSQVNYAATPAFATLPDVQSLSFASVDSDEMISLTPHGATTAPLPWRPEIIGPALEYRSPKIPRGMYSLVFGKDRSWQRYYFPDEPAELPAVKLGQAFTALPGFVPRALSDSHGKTFGAAWLKLAAFTSTSATLVDSDGRRLQMSTPIASPYAISGMAPVISDSASAAARSTYAGKDVYTNAGFGATCVRSDGRSFDLGVSGKLHVTAIYRALGSATLTTIPSGGDNNSFTAINPLVVVFALPLDGKPRFAGGEGGVAVMDPRVCVAYYALAADPWQLERTFFLKPLFSAGWPKKYRTAIAKGNVLPGMTRAMVVAAIGYPSLYATVARMNTLDHWEYDMPAPFAHDAYFKNGIVVKYNPPGDLP